MKTFLENILEKKEKEVADMKFETLKKRASPRSLVTFIKNNPEQMQVIAEVKKASPSKGEINMRVDVVAQAQAYEEAGAAAISVLTDSQYFKGNIEDLRQVAKAVQLPVLCKDFIIDQKQIVRAYNAGASLILLIVAALSETRLTHLYQKATDLGLEVLVEVHDVEELKIAERLEAKLIGVNNRNLHSFEVDIAVSENLAHQQSNQKAIYVSESGFRSAYDVARIKSAYQCILVGEALMKEKEIKQAVKNLKVSRLEDEN